MKQLISIPEVRLKQKLLVDKLSGEQGLPLAVAMVLEGVNQMLQLRQNSGTIRELVERALSVYTGTGVVMPTPQEVAKLIGED